MLDKSHENPKADANKELNDLLPSTLFSDLDINNNNDSSFSDSSAEVVDVTILIYNTLYRTSPITLINRSLNPLLSPVYFQIVLVFRCNIKIYE